MNDKHLNKAWNHSQELFKIILNATSDERIPLAVRMEIIAATKTAIDKAQSDND